MATVYNEAGEVVKAGCFVFDESGRMLLIKDTQHPKWSLPKGHVEPGEDIESAAIREVHEETGYEVELIRPLGNFHYTGGRIPCQLYVWLARTTDQNGKGEEPWSWVKRENIDELLWPEVAKFLRKNGLFNAE